MTHSDKETTMDFWESACRMGWWVWTYILISLKNFNSFIMFHYEISQDIPRYPRGSLYSPCPRCVAAPMLWMPRATPLQPSARASPSALRPFPQCRAVPNRKDDWHFFSIYIYIHVYICIDIYNIEHIGTQERTWENKRIRKKCLRDRLI